MLPTVDGRLFKIKGGNMLLPQVSVLPTDQWRKHAAATGHQLLLPWISWRLCFLPPACKAVVLDVSVTTHCMCCVLSDLHAASWHGGL